MPHVLEAHSAMLPLLQHRAEHQRLSKAQNRIRDVLSEVRRVEAKFDAPFGLGMVNGQRARFSAIEQKLGTLEEWLKRQFGAVIVRFEGVEEKVEDLGKRVREVEEAFERAVGVCEDLRGRIDVLMRCNSCRCRVVKIEKGGSTQRDLPCVLLQYYRGACVLLQATVWYHAFN